MPITRRLLPREFSLGDAARCWTDAVPDFGEDIARVKAHGSEALLKIDFTKALDREALHRYRANLARFLMASAWKSPPRPPSPSPKLTYSCSQALPP